MEPVTQQPEPTQPTAPVDTLDQAIQSGDLQAFNRIEKDRREGKAPEKLDGSEVVNKPEATAGEPGKDSAASRDAKREAGSEPAAPGKKAGHKDAKARKAEVDAEVEALEASLRRRAELRRLNEAEERAERGEKVGKPAESTAAAKESDKVASKVPGWKKYRDLPDAPKADDPEFAGLEDFTTAAAYFVAEKVAEEKFGQIDARLNGDREAVQRDQELAEVVERAVERASAEHEADPEILDRIDDRWKQLNPPSHLDGQRMTKTHWIKDQVLRGSNHPLKVSERLTSNDSAELRRILAMPPEAIIREIAYLDAEFGLPARPTSTDAPSANRVSKAPAPTPKIQGKAAAAKDDMQSAIESGDLQAFNRASMAQRKGGR